MTLNFKLLDGVAIFVDVVNSGSFTASARNSDHSTSYISKEITKLEARLGARLLNRTTRSLSLTPEGELYYQQCQQIILDAEQVENVVGGRQQEPKGTLKVSCPVSLGLSHLHPVFAKFLEQYPQVNIELDLNDRKVDMITEGFDVLIRASGQLDDSSLIARRFMRSHGVVIASPEYLSEYGTPVHPEELSQHKTISYSYIKPATVWKFKDATGKSLHVQVKSHVITNSGGMKLSLCLAGQGITRLPMFIIDKEIEDDCIIELFPDYPQQDIDVYLVYPSKKHMSSKVRCFIEFIVDALGDQ